MKTGHRPHGVRRLVGAVVLGAAFLGCTAWAQNVPTGVLDAVARDGQVRLGYSKDAPPFSAAVGGGAPVGYSVEWCGLIVDHLRQVLKKPNLQPSYVEVPQDQMLRVVASGGVHLMCAAVSDTPERRRSLGFSEPIFHSEVKLLVPTRAAARSAADLKGRTVAVLGRTSTEQAVTAFSAARGLDIKLSRVVSAEAAMGQLVLGHADAWARDEVLLLGARSRQAQPADWRLLPESLGGEAVGIAFAPDAGLQRVVDQAMAKAVRSGLAEQMHQRWFQKANVLAPSGLNLPLSPALVQAWRVFTP